MAVHAVDILEAAITWWQRYPIALQGLSACDCYDCSCPRLVFCAGTPAHSTTLVDNGSGDKHAALIFGPEYRGLSNEELNYAQRFVRIPSSHSYSITESSNRPWQFVVMNFLCVCTVEGQLSANIISVTGEYAPLDALEGYYQQLEALLLKIGYLYPHTAA